MAMDKITDNAAEFAAPPSPFEVESENLESEKDYTATELEKFTNKELAVIAAGYIQASEETIAKWAKKDIIAVILNKGIDKKTRPRQSGVKSETAILIDDLLNFLDDIKQERTNKPLYQPLRKSVRNNAVNIAEKNIAEGKINMDTASAAILVIGGIVLVVDTFIGIKPAFLKLKEFFKRKKEKE